jgi:hypothetical protein
MTSLPRRTPALWLSCNQGRLDRMVFLFRCNLDQSYDAPGLADERDQTEHPGLSEMVRLRIFVGVRPIRVRSEIVQRVGSTENAEMQP